MTNITLLVLAILMANAPLFSPKLFFIIPIKPQPKNAGWCLFEIIVLYFIFGFIVRFAEQEIMGQVSHQKWEFYAITACLFIVFSFPGAIYRFLWQN